LASSYVVAHLAPGTRITRTVDIDNDTRAEAEVSVYPAAAGIIGGSFAFAPGHTANELSSWTSVSRRTIGMAAGTEALDTVTVDVPARASAGEAEAVVWAEVSAAPPMAGGVELVSRVGIRMYLSIGSGGAPPSNFTVSRPTAERSATGVPVVAATVRNTGQAMLDLTGDVTLSQGPGGLGEGPIAVSLGAVLAPGVSEPVTAHLDNALPRGPWQADLRLTSGLVRRSATATITFPASAVTARPPTGTAFPSLGVIVIVLFVLLAITALALLLARRRIVLMRPVIDASK
jgi:hypothetical protein